MPAKVGEQAPDFTVTAHDGRRIALADLRGRVVVVFFYPKDNTPICTREACAFRDAHEEFVQAGAVVIGVSADSDDSHRQVAGSQRLPYLLVADVDGSLRRSFGVPKSFGLLPGRVTYVIDGEGIVRLIVNAQFQPHKHAREALEAVRSLQASSGAAG
jgi:peroxiredoxin Q/BCP